MKIYFAGSIRGGRDDHWLYAKIIDVLRAHGTVLTEHVGDSRVLGKEARFGDEAIFRRDVTWLQQADVVVAEVTTPSLGVGYEIGIAESLGKPVLCLHRPAKSKNLSAMVAGNSALRVAQYDSVADAGRIIESFFEELPEVQHSPNRQPMPERVYTQTFCVVGAIIERDGKILLVKEAQGHDQGKWNQPAGWIDPGEDPTDAVRREVKEETGLNFKPEAVLGIYSIAKQYLRHKVRAGIPHGVKIMYRGMVTGDAQSMVSEITEVRWFTPAEIERLGPAELRDADIKQEVNDYFAGRAYPLDLVHHAVVGN